MVSQTDYEFYLMALENSKADKVFSAIGNKFNGGDLVAIQKFLDCVLKADLPDENLKAAITAIENEYLIKNLDFLPRYLFVLYDKLNDCDLASYYLAHCKNDDEVKTNEIYQKRISKYSLPDIVQFEGNYYQNNFERTYIFKSRSKSYSVYSFSNDIGQNMTLVKTPYGALIFDCGAKCQGSVTKVISDDDLRGFLLVNGVSVEDIRGVFISHAHLDHYGSITSLLNIGIKPQIIFIDEQTKQMIEGAARDMISLKGTRPSSLFFVANNKIRVETFYNGHILGSEGFIIHFDNINIVYTGDYCLHNQHTVDGLNPDVILVNKEIQADGIDCLITESTYGYNQSYLHHDSAEKVLVHFVERLVGLGYKVFLPAFAIGRAQEIALILNPKNSVLIDGIAVKISQLYEELAGVNIFNENTRYSVNDDDKIDNFNCNNIIIASSGMITENSTSSNYIEQFLRSNNNVVMIKTGYMDNSEESHGRYLLEQWQRQGGLLLDVSLSAHADYDEIIELISKLHPNNIVSIHGQGIAHKSNNLQRDVIVEVNAEDTADIIVEEVITTDEDSKVNSGGVSYKCLDGEQKAESTDLENSSMRIEDARARAKLLNAVKAGLQIINSNANIENSQSFKIAVKQFIKSLEKFDGYASIIKTINGISSSREIHEYLSSCVECNYCCPISSKDEASDTSEDEVQLSEKPPAVEQVLANNVAEPPQMKVSKSSVQSDIMIVKCKEHDYYVSEKIHGREVYKKLLEQRAHTSTHYSDIKTARQIAVDLKNRIIFTSPDCVIIEVDMADYINDNANLDEVVTDENGNKVFGVDKNGKLVILSREGDENYRYIDKVLYNQLLNDRISFLSKKEFDFYVLGQIRAYKYASDAELKSIYFEIYKAGEFIKECKQDEELFACDILNMQGYIAGLNDAIAVQKRCVWEEKVWTVHILDLSCKLRKSSFNRHGYVKDIGSYNAIIHEKDNFNCGNNYTDVYVIIKDKTSDIDDIVEYVGLNYTYNVNTYNITKDNALPFKVENLIGNMCKLGSGDSDYSIKLSWISSLARFDDETDNKSKVTPTEVVQASTETDDEIINSPVRKDVYGKKIYKENPLFGNCAIPRSMALSYIQTLTYLFDHPNSLTSSQISVLKGMINRCIRHDQKDWRTTYLFLGNPSEEVLVCCSADLTELRDQLSKKEKGGIISVRNKYKILFKTAFDNLRFVYCSIIPDIDVTNGDELRSTLIHLEPSTGTRINVADLSKSEAKILTGAGFNYIEEMVDFSLDELLAIPNMPRTNAIKIYELLKSIKLCVDSVKSPNISDNVFAFADGMDQSFEVLIEDIGLSHRSYNCLRRAGISTLNQLIGKSKNEMLKIRNLGMKCYNEICSIAEKHGIIVVDKQQNSQ